MAPKFSFQRGQQHRVSASSSTQTATRSLRLLMRLAVQVVALELPAQPALQTQITPLASAYGQRTNRTSPQSTLPASLVTITRCAAVASYRSPIACRSASGLVKALHSNLRHTNI